jgi:hypothetical protein
MEKFPRAATQMTKRMASGFYGILMATSIKATTRMENGMVSKLYIIVLLETQLMLNIKMVS